MDFRWVGVVGTIFVGLTIISGVLGGVLFSSADVAILNQTGLTQKVDIGFITLPVPNTNFISGIFHMLSFDYPFFGGMAQLITFGLYVITFMVGFFLFIQIVSLGINAIRGR